MATAANQAVELDQVQHPTGILPCQTVRSLIDAGDIRADEPITDEQIQPSSLDLRLGAKAYRVRASFLPGPGHSVRDRLADFAMHEIDLTEGAVLEVGCVYIVPLMESLALPSGYSGIANPKSSTGRLDIFTRLIADNAAEFERVPDGYSGPLYIEISPRTFSVLVKAGTRLNQLRLRRGSPTATDAELRRLHDEVGLVHSDDDVVDIAGGIALTVDLSGEDESGLVGYRARRHTGLIDLARIGHYDPAEYWEPVYVRDARRIILDPGDFYILASKEPVTVPPHYAAEMVAYDTLVGEFRVHYAGFFDPGFGWFEEERTGTRAVLEVRSHEVPFVLEHGQVIGRLVYERLTGVPDRLYGRDIGSNYQRQGLTLAKQFKRS